MKTNGKTNPFKVADAIDAISYIYEFQYLISRSGFLYLPTPIPSAYLDPALIRFSSFFQPPYYLDPPFIRYRRVTVKSNHLFLYQNFDIYIYLLNEPVFLITTSLLGLALIF